MVLGEYRILPSAENFPSSQSTVSFKHRLSKVPIVKTKGSRVSVDPGNRVVDLCAERPDRKSDTPKTNERSHSNSSADISIDCRPNSSKLMSVGPARKPWGSLNSARPRPL